MPVIYFSSKIEGFTIHGFHVENFEMLIPVISLMIPFILPGIGILVFLGLTEKDRLKPWAKEFRNKAVKKEMEMWGDPATASRFGVLRSNLDFCGWFFILLGFLIGFKFSWLVFIFAVAVQLLVQGLMSKRV
jgi:Mg2+/citrate symporter